MRLERQTLSQAVSGAVLERIRAGEFGPGDRLPTEKALMEEYAVGRNSVREAVQALVTLGLVEVRPGRGATVIGIESENAIDIETVSALLKEEAVGDLYAFRRLLEVEIASRAAETATENDIERIAACLRAFQSALEQGREISTPDDEFHASLAAATHNSIYAIMLDAVSGLIANARRLATRIPWAGERARVEHELLLEAIRTHDPVEAAAVMRAHMDGAIEAIEEGRKLQAMDGAVPVPPAPVPSASSE
jgi:GntR family transcriptional repressor for pyruvate dehydrogenase complex